MLKPQTLKGFRDFLSLEERKRQHLITTLTSVFERFGFEQMETPVLEYEEILTGKYGEEADLLMYRFEDLGKRRVAMRYDQTVPLARVVAQYQNQITFPFKRHQISPVWRAENTQKGRYREFLQCDIDTVGTNSPLSDAEILAVIYDSFKALGLDICIKYNDRSLLKKLPAKSLPILDKLNKIGEEKVIKELTQKDFSYQESQSILEQTKSLQETPHLLEIKNNYKQMGYPEDSLQFDGTLVRGLNYYTGIILEVIVKDQPSSLSLGGGGRYNNLIGMFTKNKIPAVGFAFGFDRIFETMSNLNLFPSHLNHSSTQILITVFSDQQKAKSLELCSQLHAANIKAEIYLGEIKTKNPLEKQLKYADQKGIQLCAIIGPEEIEKNIITLKNLQTRQQQKLTLEELTTMLSL